MMVSPRLGVLPKIDRLLDIPIPIPIGKKKWVLPKKGFNRELRILVDQDLKLREMPVKEALKILEDSVADFPFADDDNGQSRCHWYARLTTPMSRAIMGWDARLPMWAFWPTDQVPVRTISTGSPNCITDTLLKIRPSRRELRRTEKRIPSHSQLAEDLCTRQSARQIQTIKL